MYIILLEHRRDGVISLGRPRRGCEILYRSYKIQDKKEGY